MFLFYFVLFLFGLAIGSFIAALTYRLPRGISISNGNGGRSFCPNCKKTIRWFDNIPLFSYVALGGKCRDCKERISPRYFFIELSTALLFVILSLFVNGCTLTLQGTSFKGSSLCFLFATLGYWVLPYLLVVTSVLIVIFIIDIEQQLIFDEFVFFAFALTGVVILFFLPSEFYARLFAGFIAGTFLLILHLVTKGRGMGLGDVKLALFAGLFLSVKYMVVWLFLSFILGAVIGLLLLLLGKARLGKPIPFGPFLVLAFMLTLLFGDKLTLLFFPFM